MANHPELQAKVFHSDFNNAPPIAALPLERQQAFVEILAEVDSGRISTIKEFARQLQQSVYAVSINASWGLPHKFQALNVLSIADSDDVSKWRVELRFIRGQDSVEDILTGAEFFERRLDYLRGVRRPIAFRPWRNLTADLPAAQAFKAFVAMCAEMGTSPRRYKALLSDSMKPFLLRFQMAAWWRGLTAAR